MAVPVRRADELRYRLKLGPPAPADQPVGKVLFFVGADFMTERPVVQAPRSIAFMPSGDDAWAGEAPLKSAA